MKRSAGTSETPPGSATGSEGRPVPSRDEETAATASADTGAADTKGWEWTDGEESSAATSATEAGASTKSPAETQGGEGPAASSGEPEQTPGQEEGRPPGGGAG